MKVKAVVFDLGKVLVDFDYGIAARKLAEKSMVAADEIRAIIDQSPLLFRYERAGMTTQEFFKEVRESIGYAGTFDEFAEAFADIFTEIPEMTRWHDQIRARRLPTFILSNTNEIAITHVRKNFPFFAHFTGYVFSYEQGVLKPEPHIYEVAERHSNFRESDLLFIDDKPENVATAAQRGWRTICHSSPAETIQAAHAWLS